MQYHIIVLVCLKKNFVTVNITLKNIYKHLKILFVDIFIVLREIFSQTLLLISRDNQKAKINVNICLSTL